MSLINLARTIMPNGDFVCEDASVITTTPDPIIPVEPVEKCKTRACLEEQKAAAKAAETNSNSTTERTTTDKSTRTRPATQTSNTSKNDSESTSSNDLTNNKNNNTLFLILGFIIVGIILAFFLIFRSRGNQGSNKTPPQTNIFGESQTPPSPEQNNSFSQPPTPPFSTPPPQQQQTVGLSQQNPDSNVKLMVTVNNLRSMGYNNERIRTTLLSQGYQNDRINNIYNWTSRHNSSYTYSGFNAFNSINKRNWGIFWSSRVCFSPYRRNFNVNGILR